MKLCLNVGCGSLIKQSTKTEKWINLDSYERPKTKLDYIWDIIDGFPPDFEKESLDFIYAEQFIEHLEWNDGLVFLQNCYKYLKPNGILRLVLPDYKKIFKAYLDDDKEFFKVFFDDLNNGDLPYYTSVYQNPEKIKRERKDNLPPAWHLSPKLSDRKRLALRLRYYRYPIEILDWFCQMYHEHKCAWDFDSLQGYLYQIGFSEVNQTQIKDIDSHAPSRVTSSIFIESRK